MSLVTPVTRVGGCGMHMTGIGTHYTAGRYVTDDVCAAMPLSLGQMRGEKRFAEPNDPRRNIA